MAIVALEIIIASLIPKTKKTLRTMIKTPPPPVPAQFNPTSKTDVTKTPAHSIGSKGLTFL